MSVVNKLQEDDRTVMVSVCCAAYNHEKYIESALQGFVNQVTDFRFEVIVHEDVSSDKTRDIIQKYVDLYPNIFVPIFQTENQYSKERGLVARNMFSKARGKYIAICEGDDYWIDKHKLQKQYDIMEKHPECSICVHDIEQVYRDGSVSQSIFKGRFKEGIVEKDKIAQILWKEGQYPFHTSSYFLRKSVLKARIENKEPFVKHMNGDMVNLRLCLLHGQFYYIDKVMSHRRREISGSWNDRWAAKSISEKVAYYREFADGEQMFDKYSGYVFHDYIKFYIFSLVSECCVYETRDIKQYLKNNPLSYKIVQDKATLWLYIRYLIMRVSPWMYKFLCSIQKKRH